MISPADRVRSAILKMDQEPDQTGQGSRTFPSRVGLEMRQWQTRRSPGAITKAEAPSDSREIAVAAIKGVIAAAQANIVARTGDPEKGRTV